MSTVQTLSERPAGVSTPAGRATTAAARRTGGRRLLRSSLTILAVLSGALLAAAVAGPRLFPFQAVSIRSGSMRPTLPVGSLVLLRRVDPMTLHVGDVITFHPPLEPDRYVTHRIVGIRTSRDGRAFVTKGDANGADDGWYVPAAGPGWRVVGSIPRLGYVSWALQMPIGRLVALAFGLVVVVAFVLVPVWRAPGGLPSATARSEPWA